MRKFNIIIAIILVSIFFSSCKEKNIEEPAFKSPIEINDEQEFLEKDDININTEESSQNYKTETKEESTQINQSKETTKEYNYIFVSINYNEIKYSKYLNDKLFDATSVYCDIDYSSLKPTKETVTATYYYRNETDGLSEGKTENVTLYQLPDNMQNDSGIHFIAAKLSDRDCEIFYKLKDTAEQSTIYDWLDTNQRLWGKNYTAVDEIKNITIIEQKANGRQCIIDDTIDISGFFERICNFKYKADTEYRTVGRENEKPGLYGITINYKDGYQMTFTFERIKQVLQGNYLTDDEFEDYLLSFLE